MATIPPWPALAHLRPRRAGGVVGVAHGDAALPTPRLKLEVELPRLPLSDDPLRCRRGLRSLRAACHACSRKVSVICGDTNEVLPLAGRLTHLYGREANPICM